MSYGLDLGLLSRVIERANTDTDAVRGYVLATGANGLTRDQIFFIQKAFAEAKKESGKAST